jgi:hypothetical protein
VTPKPFSRADTQVLENYEITFMLWGAAQWVGGAISLKMSKVLSHEKEIRNSPREHVKTFLSKIRGFGIIGGFRIKSQTDALQCPV